MNDYISFDEASDILKLSKQEIFLLIKEKKLFAKDNKICTDSIYKYINDNMQSRRTFIKGSLSLLMVSTAFSIPIIQNVAGGLSTAFILDKFKEDIGESSFPNSTDLKNKIFGDINSASWSTNITHLLQTYGINDFRTSSTYIAATDVAKSLLNNKDIKKFKTTSFPAPVFIDGDILCIGGPTSDPIAKLSFELEGKQYQEKRKQEFAIDLPILQNYTNSNEIGKRYISGQLKNINNSCFSINNEIIEPPKFDNNNLLKTDYLLITRIPNIINKEAFNKGSNVLIIGGLHGTGTEAIKLILNNINLLLDIYTIKKEHPYFQSLFRIDEIEHINYTNGFNKSIPTKVSHIETKVVEIDNERILKHFKHEPYRNI